MSILLPSAGILFVYLGFAACALWLTTRFVRRLTLAAAVVLVLLPCAFTGKALVTGSVYAPLDLPYQIEPLASYRVEHGMDEHVTRSRYDMAFQIIPWRKATRYAIENGEWPIWNPFILSGDILAASAQPAAYHPINVIAYLLPLGPSLTFCAAAVFFLAGLCSFLYLREVGCREPPAVVAAAGWMFCQFMLFWSGWPLAMPVAVFPLVMLAARRIARKPGLSSAGLLTVALTLLLLGGHPESTLHCVAVGVAYGLCEFAVHIVRLRPSLRLRAAVRCLAAGLSAGVLALLLTAVDLLPFVDALGQTHEVHQRSDPSHHVVHSVPWGEAFARMRIMAAPFAYGAPIGPRVPSSRFGPWWSPYVGSVLFAPVLFGLWRSRWRGRWLMLALVVGGTLAYVGAPFPNQLMADLPLFEISINRRLGFVAAFAAVALAALGIEAWMREPRSPRLGLLTLGVGALQGGLIALFWTGMRDSGVDTDFMRVATLLELVPVIAVAVMFLSVRSARLGVALLLLAILVQRGVQTAPMNPTYPESVFYPTVPVLEALPRDGEPYRVTRLGTALRPNMAALYELEDVGGYQTMRNRRLFSTYPLWVGPENHHRHNAQVTDLRRPFLSFLNVRYALAAAKVKAPRKWRVVAADRGAVLYENPAVIGRAFVPDRVRVGVPASKVLREMEAQKDFSRVAWIEDAAEGARGGRPVKKKNGPGRVRSSRGARGLQMDVEMDGPGWVVVSQTAWNGWRASTDGRNLPLRFANRAFLAFHLPAGHHVVDLEYLPRSFVIGRALTLATLASLIVVGLFQVLGRRRALALGSL
jgi:hypothetical protein